MLRDPVTAYHFAQSQIYPHFLQFNPRKLPAIAFHNYPNSQLSAAVHFCLYASLQQGNKRFIIDYIVNFPCCHDHLDIVFAV